MHFILHATAWPANKMARSLPRWPSTTGMMSAIPLLKHPRTEPLASPSWPPTEPAMRFEDNRGAAAQPLLPAFRARLDVGTLSPEALPFAALDMLCFCSVQIVCTYLLLLLDPERLVGTRSIGTVRSLPLVSHLLLPWSRHVGRAAAPASREPIPPGDA